MHVSVVRTSLHSRKRLLFRGNPCYLVLQLLQDIYWWRWSCWYHQDTAQRPEWLLYISGSEMIKVAGPLTTWITEWRDKPFGSGDLLCCSDRLCSVLLCCEAHSDRKIPSNLMCIHILLQSGLLTTSYTYNTHGLYDILVLNMDQLSGLVLWW